MQPKSGSSNQGDLFRSRLDQILNRQHPLYRVATAACILRQGVPGKFDNTEQHPDSRDPQEKEVYEAQ